MSSFDGTDYFGSGPHALAVGPRGKQWARKTDLGAADAGIQVLGDHTLTIEVRGRLAASDAAALFAVSGAIEAVLGDKGALVDDAGRTWTGVTLIEVVYDGPAQVGREWTIGYTALFADV